MTYHPYTRSYIDYVEQVIRVPVEKVKKGYYERIIETDYVAQPVEEIVNENVAVER